MSAVTAAGSPWSSSTRHAGLEPEPGPSGARPAPRTPALGAGDLGDADEPVSHLDLLAGARRLQRLAVHGDAAALHDELRRFRDALVRHTHHEQRAFVHLSAVAQQIIGRGQRQLLDHVDQLIAGGRPDFAGRTRIAELAWLLRRQARLEAGLLHERPR